MKSEIDVAQVYRRLRKCGVNIQSRNEVVLALESEIRHYRDVIHELGRRQRLTPLPPLEDRMVCDWETCRAPEVSQVLHEINAYGYELISVTQHGEVYSMFFRKRAADA